LHAVPDLRAHDLSSMRRWIYGGGPLGRDMALRLIEAYGTENFVQVYGMTETGPLGTALYPSTRWPRRARSVAPPPRGCRCAWWT